MTDRRESWQLKPDQSFSSLEDAQDYVRQKSRIHTELPNFIVGLPEAQKSQAVDEFCFSEKYLFYQRYFIGKPDVKKIKAAVEAHAATFQKMN